MLLSHSRRESSEVGDLNFLIRGLDRGASWIARVCGIRTVRYVDYCTLSELVCTASIVFNYWMEN